MPGASDSEKGEKQPARFWFCLGVVFSGDNGPGFANLEK